MGSVEKVNRLVVTVVLSMCILIALFGEVRGETQAGGIATIVQSVENPVASDGRAAPSIIHFRNGRRFETTIYEVQVIGVLRVDGKMPYVVMAGRSCSECDANIAIYIHSPDDGPMRGEDKQTRFSYPGRVNHFLEGTLVEEWRVFLGRCLTQDGEVAVWFGRERSKRGKWVETVVAVRVVGAKLRVKQLQKPLPRVEEALKLVTAGACREIPGIEQTTEP